MEGALNDLFGALEVLPELSEDPEPLLLIEGALKDLSWVPVNPFPVVGAIVFADLPRSRLRSEIDAAPLLASAELNPPLWDTSLSTLKPLPLILFTGSITTTVLVPWSKT
jgi:hypothetical protein